MDVVQIFEFCRKHLLRFRREMVFVFAVIGLSTAIKSQAEQPDCIKVSGNSAEYIAARVGLKPSAIVTLQGVFKRLAQVAKLTPELIVCDSKNFNAYARPAQFGRRSEIVVDAGTLAVVDTDVDVLARFIGHEFAHLYLSHNAEVRMHTNDLKANARLEAISTARRIGVDKVDFSKIQQAFEFQKMEFSRTIEFEADELGFNFATRAGYGLVAVERITTILKSVGDQAYASYSSSHPGYLERLQLGVFLEKNTANTQDARKLFASKNWLSLGKLWEKWIVDVPESATAHYYSGLWLNAAHAQPWKVTEAFEDSMLRFERPAVAVVTQRSQFEASAAPLLLALSLYDEGELMRSLSSASLLSSELLSQYKELTNWNSILVMGEESDQNYASSLWHAVGADGVVVISNLDSHKDERWMKPVRAWNAPRQPKAWAGKNAGQPSQRAIQRISFSDLVEAAAHGDEMDIYLQLKSGADANLQIAGISPLGSAVMAGKIENVSYLLIAGARPNVQDGFGRSPLDYALHAGRIDILEVLNKAFVKETAKTPF